MTPEQEQAVADFAMWANAERREGMTIRHLADNFAAHVEEDRKHFAKHDRRIQRLTDAMRDSGVRAPMASLSADDSGSIDIAVFGSKAKFQGPMALRIAVGLIVIVGIAFAGYTARAIAEKPASQQGAKP
jgi:hypothetical protein